MSRNPALLIEMLNSLVFDGNKSVNAPSIFVLTERELDRLSTVADSRGKAAFESITLPLTAYSFYFAFLVPGGIGL